MNGRRAAPRDACSDRQGARNLQFPASIKIIRLFNRYRKIIQNKTSGAQGQCIGKAVVKGCEEAFKAMDQ
jgi:hypothetical protein